MLLSPHRLDRTTPTAALRQWTARMTLVDERYFGGAQKCSDYEIAHHYQDRQHCIAVRLPTVFESRVYCYPAYTLVDTLGGYESFVKDEAIAIGAYDMIAKYITPYVGSAAQATYRRNLYLLSWIFGLGRMYYYNGLPEQPPSVDVSHNGAINDMRGWLLRYPDRTALWQALVHTHGEPVPRNVAAQQSPLPGFVVDDFADLSLDALLA